MARFAWDGEDESAPGPDIVPVTPSDTADQSTTIGNTPVVGYRAIRANTAGTIRVTMESGAIRTLNWAAAETKPGCFVRVWATGTTCSGIEGFV